MEKRKSESWRWDEGEERRGTGRPGVARPTDGAVGGRLTKGEEGRR